MTEGSQRVVADVGGTNTRIAVFDEASGKFTALATFTNRDFSRLEDLVIGWLDTLETAPTRACIAIAAPPTGDRVRMVNMDWAFSRAEFSRATRLANITWINDFVGNAHALPYLAANDRVELHAGKTGAAERYATVGPGTGLGGATVERASAGWRASPCEPGFTGLSPANPLELALFELLLAEYDEVFAELLVSGPGLLRLYQALATVRGENAEGLSPTDVSRRALSGEDPLCVESLGTFCALLGSLCGDFLLSTGAYGGLYLAGGIVPQVLPFLTSSDFHQRLCQKGAMSPLLQRVPVYVITAEHPGLIGAAHAPLES